jgi:predicted metal-dependent phosphoesterase TrpH
MEGICDLHVHSTCSDGTVSPAALISLARERNLQALALCDHNTVAGLPEFLSAAAGSGIEAVPGVEFSTDYRGTELHILALFVQPRHYGAVTEQVEQMMQRKEESNIRLVQALRGAGIWLDYEKIKAGTPNGQVNRAVIAAEMVRQGYSESVQEAFSCWLSEKRGYFQPPRRLDALETIAFIKAIGAVAVLAHPFLNLDEAGLREFLPRAVAAGLDGMECYYPKFDAEQTALAEQLCDTHGLLRSGGSDFHGQNKPDIQLGTGRGNLRVSCGLLEKLRQRAAL